MKNSRVIASVSLLFLALAGPARPESGPDGNIERQLDSRMWALQLQAQFDKDATGREELAKKNLFSSAGYDLNHDGVLDARELLMWVGHVRAVIEQTPKLMAKYDVNRDGRLDDAERTAAIPKVVAKK